MDLFEVLKIVVPIVIALIGTIFVLLRWAIDRQAQSTQKMWELFQASIGKNIHQLSVEVASFKADFYDWRNRYDARVHALEQKLSRFEKEVAGQYIKRRDWLEHALSLEKKVDLLRNDIHKELQEIYKEITKKTGDKP